MPRNNQHTSLPQEDLDSNVRKLFDEGKTDVTIAKCIQDTTGFKLSTKTIQRSRVRQGLLNAWNAKLTPADIADDFAELRTIYTTAGAVRMKGFMLIRKGLHVPRSVISQHMQNVEPEATTARKGKRIQRRQQYIAGVNVTWTMDQHDKWRKYGLLLHVGLDICSGYVLWAKVWWNNRNPNLICKYYLDAVESTGGIPLLTQSDGGSENFNVAKAQTTMRQAQDPALIGSIQHRWMGHRFNTPPETFWSGMRMTWSPGFEQVFEYGVSEGLYDSNNLLQQMVFRWLAVPWMQRELDIYRRTVNLTKKRHDKRKLLPQGRPPQDIFSMPAASGLLDFKVSVDNATLEETRQQYAAPEHPVFKLVSDDFDAAMTFLMQDLGFPVVDMQSFWNIYCELLALVAAFNLDMDKIAAREMALSEDFRGQENELLAAARAEDPTFGTDDWIGQAGRLNVGNLPVVLDEDGQSSGDDSESGSEIRNRGDDAFVDEEGRVWLPGLDAMLAADGIL